MHGPLRFLFAALMASAAATSAGRAQDAPIEPPWCERFLMHDLLLDPPAVMGVESMDIDQFKVRLVARTEGVLLDPVYAGKAMAGLIDHIRRGEIGSDESVVFLHTGGTPALFAYAAELSEYFLRTEGFEVSSALSVDAARRDLHSWIFSGAWRLVFGASVPGLRRRHAAKIGVLRCRSLC